MVLAAAPAANASALKKPKPRTQESQSSQHPASVTHSPRANALALQQNATSTTAFSESPVSRTQLLNTSPTVYQSKNLSSLPSVCFALARSVPQERLSLPSACFSLAPSPVSLQAHLSTCRALYHAHGVHALSQNAEQHQNTHGVNILPHNAEQRRLPRPRPHQSIHPEYSSLKEGVPVSPRRSLLCSAGALALGTLVTVSPPSHAALEDKTRNLPLEERKSIIAGDIRDRQYFVTGQMTKSIYRDDCYFIDPMNQVGGLANYILGISLFLDPNCASNELVSISATAPNIVEATWTLSGYFRYLPWQPYLPPITGGTRYTFDDEGLVVLHEETWSISPLEAYQITLTPQFLQKENTCKAYSSKSAL